MPFLVWHAYGSIEKQNNAKEAEDVRSQIHYRERGIRDHWSRFIHFEKRPLQGTRHPLYQMRTVCPLQLSGCHRLDGITKNKYESGRTTMKHNQNRHFQIEHFVSAVRHQKGGRQKKSKKQNGQREY